MGHGEGIPDVRHRLNCLIVDKATTDDNSGEEFCYVSPGQILVLYPSRDSEPHHNGTIVTLPRRYNNHSVCSVLHLYVYSLPMLLTVERSDVIQF